MSGDPTRWLGPFLEAKSAERGAAENTLDAYRRDLTDFLDWLARKEGSAETCAQSVIERYLIDCDRAGLARSTRARRLSAIRQFFAFLYEEDVRADNPALRLSGPGRDRRIPKTLDEDEVDRLLSAAREVGRSTTDKLRNTCLMELLYATGMRVSELVGLPVAAVRGDPRLLLVRGKGGKERMVPLTDAARLALAAWLERRDRDEAQASREGGRASAFLFPSRGRTGHLTRHAFYQIIKQLAVQAGISPAKVTPHVIRHAFATHLLANGADLRSIQTLLGHADVATTEIYTHVLSERLEDLVLTHHPLAAKD